MGAVNRAACCATYRVAYHPTTRAAGHQPSGFESPSLGHHVASLGCSAKCGAGKHDPTVVEEEKAAAAAAKAQQAAAGRMDGEIDIYKYKAQRSHSRLDARRDIQTFINRNSRLWQVGLMERHSRCCKLRPSAGCLSN